MTPLRRLAFALAAPVIVVLVRCLWATLRFELRGDEALRRLDPAAGPLILSFWHDSIFICSWYVLELARRGFRVTYLVSPSVDGELAVRVLRVIGAEAVRGSATRSGVKAIHGMYRAMVSLKASPVVVPDGPQGPPRHCKLGSVMLAQLSGAPMVPIGCAARSAWRLRTWDRLQFPRPFTRVVVTVGEPLRVPSQLDDAAREEQRALLEQRLEALVAESESGCSTRRCTE